MPEPLVPAPTFDENVASIAEDEKRMRAELERMQRALEARKQAKWKKKGLTK